MYTKTGCPFCAALLRDFEGRGVPYREINVGDHPERIPELLKLTGGRRVVPVVVDGGGISVSPRGGTDF